MTLLYSTHTNFSHFPTSLPVPMASSTSNEKLWYYNRETLFYLSTKEAALKLFLKGSYLDWSNFVNFNSPTYMIKLIGKKMRNKGKGEKIWMSEKNLNLHLKPPAPPPPPFIMNVTKLLQLSNSGHSLKLLVQRVHFFLHVKCPCICFLCCASWEQNFFSTKLPSFTTSATYNFPILMICPHI